MEIQYVVKIGRKSTGAWKELRLGLCQQGLTRWYMLLAKLWK
ncbi:MAG: hypothetical protein U0173_14480 [Nitrospiraceae bacterium]